MREHKAHASASVAFALLTVSDTRTAATDSSGARARELLEAAGHRVVWQRLVADEADLIRSALREALDDAAVEAFVSTGGTGVSPRDVTIEAVAPFLDKELPGFGELFRHLSFAEIGTAAMASRATAGVARGKPVFVLPGSRAAVELAVARLVAPEVGHLAHLARG